MPCRDECESRINSGNPSTPRGALWCTRAEIPPVSSRPLPREQSPFLLPSASSGRSRPCRVLNTPREGCAMGWIQTLEKVSEGHYVLPKTKTMRVVRRPVPVRQAPVRRGPRRPRPGGGRLRPGRQRRLLPRRHPRRRHARLSRGLRRAHRHRGGDRRHSPAHRRRLRHRLRHGAAEDDPHRRGRGRPRQAPAVDRRSHPPHRRGRGRQPRAEAAHRHAPHLRRGGAPWRQGPGPQHLHHRARLHPRGG